MVTTKYEPYPTDISVSRQEELLYSDYLRRTVNIVRPGRIETLITLPEGWHPRGLCCTRSGDILLNMCTPDQSNHKIVRFQGKTAIQDIYKDEYGLQIFRGLGVVQENNNGYICSSDVDAKTVIVVDKRERVPFRYDGTPANRINRTCIHCYRLIWPDHY
ncbi:uncharacterized protein LOC134248170 [Saccostrea cucullata]|uniref:uncharacterized protein LOC134248170 n=1 Tax=Saccostrea cuccullata TaxID=36930 RepID=UPI002ED0E335